MRLYKPFIKLRDIKRFQVQYPHWPPKDASPSFAMEPWGKNWFVFNGRVNVELKGDTRAPPWVDTRPEWLIEENKLSLLKDGEDPNDFLLPFNKADLSPEELNQPSNQTETVLAVTDFRKRPLTFLSPEDFRMIKANLSNIRKWMDEYEIKCKMINEAIAADDSVKRQAVELDLNKTRIYRRGRWMKPRHDKGGRGARSGRIRLKRKT